MIPWLWYNYRPLDSNFMSFLLQVRGANSTLLNFSVFQCSQISPKSCLGWDNYVNQQRFPMLCLRRVPTQRDDKNVLILKVGATWKHFWWCTPRSITPSLTTNVFLSHCKILETGNSITTKPNSFLEFKLSRCKPIANMSWMQISCWTWRPS